MTVESSCFRKFEQAQSAFVARAGADGAIEARYGFGVVVQHFRVRVDDDADGVFAALEIGDENFDLAAGSLLADLFDDEREGACAAEDIVIAVHAGDDGVLEAEGGDGFRHAAGFVKIDGVGTALGHGAEAAAPGAEVAEHHERRGLVVPAFADVGAVGALADGVQVEVAGKLLECVEIVADRGLGLQPLGLGGGLARGEIDLHQVL